MEIRNLTENERSDALILAGKVLFEESGSWSEEGAKKILAFLNKLGFAGTTNDGPGSGPPFMLPEFDRCRDSRRRMTSRPNCRVPEQRRH